MMIKKISRIIAIALVQLGVLGVLVGASALPAQAAGESLFPSAAQEACGGAQLGNAADCSSGEDKLEGIIKVALNLLSIAAGVAATIMLIIAGIRYTTSGGDSAGVSGAKNTIIYAIIGISIVAVAQLLVTFVVDKIT